MPTAKDPARDIDGHQVDPLPPAEAIWRFDGYTFRCDEDGISITTHRALEQPEVDVMLDRYLRLRAEVRDTGRLFAPRPPSDEEVPF